MGFVAAGAVLTSACSEAHEPERDAGMGVAADAGAAAADSGEPTESDGGDVVALYGAPGP